MSNPLWSAQVSQVGGDADELIEAGVLILFGDPVPEALADVSVVHTGATALARVPRAGDRFLFAGQTYAVDEVGSRVGDNLTELGHVVLYANQPEQELLPGAVKVTGPAPGTPDTGSAISFVEA